MAKEKISETLLNIFTKSIGGAIGELKDRVDIKDIINNVDSDSTFVKVLKDISRNATVHGSDLRGDIKKIIIGIEDKSMSHNECLDALYLIDVKLGKEGAMLEDETHNVQLQTISDFPIMKKEDPKKYVEELYEDIILKSSVKLHDECFKKSFYGGRSIKLNDEAEILLKLLLGEGLFSFMEGVRNN